MMSSRLATIPPSAGGVTSNSAAVSSQTEKFNSSTITKKIPSPIKQNNPTLPQFPKPKTLKETTLEPSMSLDKSDDSPATRHRKAN